MSGAPGSSWPTTRVKRIAAKIGSGKTPAGGNETYETAGVLFLRSQNIHFDGMRLDDVVYINDETDREMSSTRVRAEDSLLNITGASLGRVARFPSGLPRANVNQHVCIVRPRRSFDARYLAWSLAGNHVQQQIHALQVGGNRDGLNFEQVGNLDIPLPPLEEQRRIADFLDAETARIDLLSESRIKQLDMIAEHGAAEVHNTVRGATLGSAMHHSGLDWLGDIAEDFRMAAVSHEFEVALGKMLNPERAQGDHLRPYLRNTNVQWDDIDTDDLLLMNFPPDEQIRYQVHPGDLLVCEGGDPGRAAIWNGSIKEIYYQKALHRVRPRGESTVRWLYYCLRAATYLNIFAVQGNSTTIAHLTGEQLKTQRFPFPSRAIQDQLVKVLDERTEHRRRFEAAIDRQLALLAERRQALITAAVTGQIDVTTARGLSSSGGVAI